MGNRQTQNFQHRKYHILGVTKLLMRESTENEIDQLQFFSRHNLNSPLKHYNICPASKSREQISFQFFSTTVIDMFLKDFLKESYGKAQICKFSKK